MDKDTFLQYARTQLEALGLDYSAKVEAVKRVREQFSLGLREAKDVVDEVYEEMCEEAEAEEEEFEEDFEDFEDDEEDEFEDNYEIIDEFVQSLEGAGDHAVMHDAGFVISSLHDFLRDYHGIGLDELDRDLIEEYLIDYYPRKVTADEKTVERVPSILTLFLQFAGRKGFIKTTDPLIQTVERLREKFKQAALDPRNFGPAKSFATAMLKAGVDPSDQKQVDAFMLDYNLRMLSQMPPPRAQISSPLTKPSAARNAPCPCGSGRKYKRCCGKT